MHSPIFGEFPIKPGYISLNFCVARNEQKGEWNMKETKLLFKLVSVGFLMLSACGLCDCYIQSLQAKQIKELQQRVEKLEKEKEDAE